MSKKLINSKISTGLVGYWPLNGNSQDRLGINHGVDTNVTYTTGKVGQGAYFNGVQFSSGSRIAIGTNSSFNFIHQTQIFSLSFWLKANNYTSLNGLFLASTYPLVGSIPNGVGIIASIQPDGSLFFQVQVTPLSNTDGVYAHTNPGVITDNGFHHIVLTVDRSITTSKIYVDGVYVTTIDAGAWNLGTGDANILTLGAWMYAWGSYQFVFGGVLDEFAIWNRVLSEYEIKRIYNSNKGLRLA